jgi:ATP-dependent DNA helicase RecQ
MGGTVTSSTHFSIATSADPLMFAPSKFIHLHKNNYKMKNAVGSWEKLPPISREENLRALTTQILKTMLLLGKPYGQTYVINVMTGNPKTDWRDLTHTQLETFGVVPSFLVNRLTCVLHYLVDVGLIEANAPACNVLNITDAGKAWLDEPTDLLARSARMKYTALEGYLRKALCIHRTEVSKLSAMSPWMIFTDFTLDRIVLAKPLGLEHLSRVPGFDIKKCESFGPAIVRIVQDVLENYAEFRRQHLIQLAKGKGYQAVKTMFTDNLTLPEIAKAAALKVDTVVKYLCDLHEIGDVDMVPWIEKNINSKSLFKGVEYFNKVTEPSLAEGRAILGLDINVLRFAYLYKQDSDAKKEEMRQSA